MPLSTEHLRKESQIGGKSLFDEILESRQSGSIVSCGSGRSFKYVSFNNSLAQWAIVALTEIHIGLLLNRTPPPPPP